MWPAASLEAVVEIDNSCAIQHAGKEAAVMFGYQAANLKGASLTMLLKLSTGVLDSHACGAAILGKRKGYNICICWPLRVQQDITCNMPVWAVVNKVVAGHQTQHDSCT